jgi:hypothetical protein
MNLMASSENSINKVRSILGKMDRSITDARKRRLGEPETRLTPLEGDEDQILIGRSEADEAQAKPPAPQPPEPLSPMRARYGKARPIAPPSQNQSNGYSNGHANGHSNGNGNGPLGYQARPA